jgi:hypothetical protein
LRISWKDSALTHLNLSLAFRPLKRGQNKWREVKR